MICYWNAVLHIHFAHQSHLSLCCKPAVITTCVYLVRRADFSYDSYSVGSYVTSFVSLPPGDAHLVSVSCGTQNVVVVDNTGQAYLRIGVKAPEKHHLCPAWVPLDGTTSTAGSKFTSIYTSPADWLVSDWLALIVYRVVLVTLHILFGSW